MSKMIPLRIADMAVAACDAEIQKLREEVARLHKEVALWKERYEGTTEAKLGREIYGIPKEPKP